MSQSTLSNAVSSTSEDNDSQQSYSSSTLNAEKQCKAIETIMRNNRGWVDKKVALEKSFFTRTGGPQHPEYLYFGCADSRVPPTEFLGLEPGEVFVHRNVGNLVKSDDANAMAVLEFAVNNLGVKHILITGHYECGAVAGSLGGALSGLVEHWITSIRDTKSLHEGELSKLSLMKEKARRLVELNVQEQCLNVFKTRIVQNKREESRKSPASEGEAYPQIHGMVYDPLTGLLNDVPINWDAAKALYGLH